MSLTEGRRLEADLQLRFEGVKVDCSATVEHSVCVVHYNIFCVRSSYPVTQQDEECQLAPVVDEKQVYHWYIVP